MSDEPNVQAGEKPKNKQLRTILIAAVIVAVLGCLCIILALVLFSSQGNQAAQPPSEVEQPAELPAEPTNPPEPTDIPQPTATPEPTSSPIGTSRDNPAPPGTTVEVPNFAFVLTGATRPANDIVAAGNMFNTEPEAGQEYVMAELSVTCLQEQCDFSLFNFGLVGSQGIVYDPEIFVTGVDGMLEDGELFQGAVLEGKVFFIVAQDDTGLVLRWEPLIGDAVYMAVSETGE